MTANVNIFEWVPFDEVWQAFEEHFASDDFFKITQYPNGPNPETIYRLVENTYGLFDLSQIPDWESYEYGKIEYSNEYFIEKLFGNIDIDEVPFFYIIINKCFTERKVLKVKGTDLVKFIDTAPELIEYHIFQPCDVIFIADAPFTVAVLDHNGYYMPVDIVEVFRTMREVKAVIESCCNGKATFADVMVDFEIAVARLLDNIKVNPQYTDAVINVINEFADLDFSANEFVDNESLENFLCTTVYINLYSELDENLFLDKLNEKGKVLYKQTVFLYNYPQTTEEIKRRERENDWDLPKL